MKKSVMVLALGVESTVVSKRWCIRQTIWRLVAVFLLFINVAIVRGIRAENRALRFDGYSDYVNIPDNQSLDLTSGITIEAWLKIDNVPNTHMHFVSKNEGAGSGDKAYALNTDGNLSPYIFLGNICLDASNPLPPMTKEIWVHLAGTFDGNWRKFYINGILQYSIPCDVGSVLYPNDLPLSLGKLYYGGGCQFLDGEMDEVRIWRVARTESEIRGCMYRHLTVAETTDSNLIVYFDFDNEYGQILTDRSVYHNNGRLGSSASTDSSDPLWVSSTVPLYAHLTRIYCINNQQLNVTGHYPTIVWQYLDWDDTAQDSFHIAAGTDPDWNYAEMWNPAPVASSDTFVTYAGAELIDGQTYYLRLRVHNGTVWSAWYDTLFRMNSLPSVPTPLWPADEEVVNETFPTLYIQNSRDAEADSLTYDFWIAKWNPLGPPFDPYIDSTDNLEGQDSTGWTVPNEYPLEDNEKYFWMARAFDQFEKTGWSDPLRSFWVNTVEEAPWPFDLIYPPDTAGSIIFDMLPQFYWRIVTEPDPFDTVTHTLYLAVDSNFQFVQTISDIPFNYYDLSESLWFGTRYWWKVKAVDAKGNATYSSNTLSFRTWKLGDANSDWVVNILDVTFLISALYKGGNQPSPAYVGDVNGNCVTNILDATYLIAYLYKSGASPRVGCE